MFKIIDTTSKNKTFIEIRFQMFCMFLVIFLGFNLVQKHVKVQGRTLVHAEYAEKTASI